VKDSGAAPRANGTDPCALRGEAEEAIRHLRANLELKRIRATVFWRLSNRLITIVKMLTSLLNS